MNKSSLCIKATLCVIFICFRREAHADLTFSQWASGPADKRAIYTAGVIETVGVYAEVLGFVESWKQCLSKEKLTYGAISEGALEFAKKNPAMDGQPAPAVFIAFMNVRCGLTAVPWKK